MRLPSYERLEMYRFLLWKFSSIIDLPFVDTFCPNLRIRVNFEGVTRHIKYQNL